MWQVEGEKQKSNAPWLLAKNERPKPEYREESTTSILGSGPTIAKNWPPNNEPERVRKNNRPKRECRVESLASILVGFLPSPRAARVVERPAAGRNEAAR